MSCKFKIFRGESFVNSNNELVTCSDLGDEIIFCFLLNFLKPKKYNYLPKDLNVCMGVVPEVEEPETEGAAMDGKSFL